LVEAVMCASSGVVPKSGARLVMVVVIASSIKAIAVHSSTKRTRQPIEMAVSRGTSLARRTGVSEPPTMIQNRISPSAIRRIARSLVLAEAKMKAFNRVTSRPL
jgi:hypothetical protein